MELSQKNPFKGLQPYGEKDQEKLFGREKDLILIKDRIYSANTTLLFAGSGVGKTSFLNAKVIPEFKQQYYVFYHNDWAGKDKPLDAVKKRLAEQLKLEEELLSRPLTDILSRFRKATDKLSANYFEGVDNGALHRCLLILDQFEEVFQYHSYEEYFEQFLDEICTAINDPDLQLRIVFSMREEFLGELSVFDNRIPDLFNNYYRLKYPDKEEAKDIIALTCELVDVNVDDDKLDKLVRDLSKVEKTAASYTEFTAEEETQKTRMIERGFIIPPYLQITCQKLWGQQFAPSKNGVRPPEVFLKNYKENEAQKMLQDFCTEKLNKLTLAERYVASRAFNFLVTKQGAKMAYESKRLSQHMRVSETRLKKTLEKLSKPDTRILRISRAPDGSNWFELYHDIYGTIVDRWKQGFQRKLVRWALGTVAGVTLLVSLVVSLLLAVPYWRTHPKEYRQIIESSDGSNYALAEDAYTRLRLTYGYAATADSMWAKFWERRAESAERSEKREEALLFRLNALTFEPDPKVAERRRVEAGRLVGGDYGSLLATYRHEGSRARAIFSADGEFVLMQTSGNDDDVSVGVWNAATGEPLTRSIALELIEKKDNKGLRYTWSPFEDSSINKISVEAIATTSRLIAGTYLVPKTGKRGVLLWNFDSGKLYPDTLPQPLKWCDPDDGLSVVLSSDGRYLATGGTRGVINVWKLDRKGDSRQFILVNASRITSLAFSPDGTTLLSAGADGRFRLWDMNTGRLRMTAGSAAAGIKRATFSPDGTAFLTAHEDGSLKVWEAATGNPAGPPIETGYFVSAASLASDNKTVVTLVAPFSQSEKNDYEEYLTQQTYFLNRAFKASGFEDETMFISFYNFNSKELIQRWDSRTGKLLSQYLPEMKKWGRNLLSPDGEALLVPVVGGAQLFSVPSRGGEQLGASGDYIRELKLSPDGETLVSRLADKKLQLWNAQTGMALYPRKTYQKLDYDQPYSAYGSVVAVGKGNVVRVWDISKEREIASLLHPGNVERIEYSPDGKTLVTADSRSILHFWDTSSYSERAQSRMQKGGEFMYWKFSASGRYAIMSYWGLEHSLMLQDLISGSLISISEFKEQRFEPSAAAFSPDDRMLAITNGDSTQIWELPSGNLLRTLRTDNAGPILSSFAHLNSSNDCKFSNDGKTLFTASGRRSLMLWDVEKVTLLGAPIRYNSYLRATSFSPDGKSFLVFTTDWIHLYSLGADSVNYVSSRFIGGGWVEKLLLDESGKNIRFFFRSPDGTLNFNDVRFDGVDPKNALAGEPKALLGEWQNRLSLKFDQVNLIPRFDQANFIPKS